MAKVQKTKQPAAGKPGARREYDRAELVPMICARLQSDDPEPMAVICRDLGISVRTVNQWRQDDPEIAAQFTEAFETGMHVIAWRSRKTARGKAPKDGGDSTGNVQRDKLIVDNDHKLLSKWAYALYGDALKLSGDPENPLTGMSDEQVDARLAVLLAKREASA